MSSALSNERTVNSIIDFNPIIIVNVSAQGNHCGKIWLTISSLWRPIATSDKVIDAELEINWNLECPSESDYPDTIKLFSADPADGIYFFYKSNVHNS